MLVEPKWLIFIKNCLSKEGTNATSRFMQLATVSVDGHASVRTVVFRGWYQSNSQNDKPSRTSLKLITDSRSEKMMELNKNPWAEICWYFVDTRQQFRLTGMITLIDHDEKDPILAAARISQWKELSNASRLQFRFPPPGELRTKNKDSTLFQPEPPSIDIPEDNFVLALLEPTKVDVVDLRANERRIFSINSSEDWDEQYVNP